MKKLSEVQLEDTILSRLLIVEELEGKEIKVEIKKPSIISEESSPTINVSEEEHQDEISAFMETSTSKFFEHHEDISYAEMTLKTLDPDDGIYLTSGKVLALDSMYAKYNNDEKRRVGQAVLPDVSNMFGFMTKPTMQPPGSLTIALKRGDKEVIETICNSIRNRLSMYARHDYEPEFVALPGSYLNKEEEELRWTI